MTKKKIVFAVEIDYDNPEDNVVCPDSMKDNLEAELKRLAKEGLLTVQPINSQIQRVEIINLKE